MREGEEACEKEKGRSCVFENRPARLLKAQLAPPRVVRCRFQPQHPAIALAFNGRGNDPACTYHRPHCRSGIRAVVSRRGAAQRGANS